MARLEADDLAEVLLVAEQLADPDRIGEWLESLEVSKDALLMQAAEAVGVNLKLMSATREIPTSMVALYLTGWLAGFMSARRLDEMELG